MRTWSFVGLLAATVLAGCASAESAPDEAVETVVIADAAPAWEPTYHARADIRVLSPDVSKALLRTACAELADLARCDSRSKSLRGYRGAFSQPGADEALVAMGEHATLLARSGGGWTLVAVGPDLDVARCLHEPTAGAEAVDQLVCRAADLREHGHGLHLFTVGLAEAPAEAEAAEAEEAPAEEGDAGDAAEAATPELVLPPGPRLVARPLDAPQADDLDTTFFSGWRHADDGLELRFHSQTEVAASKSIDFGGGDACPYRTFRHAAGQGLVELDRCTAEPAPTAEPSDGPISTGSQTLYEERLDEPLRKHGRAYATCYLEELARLEKVTAEAEAEATAEGQLAEDDAAADDAAEPEPTRPLQGSAHARFVIGSAGAPVSCEITETTLGNANVERCLCRAIMETPFPANRTGELFEVTYPFQFSPQ